MEDTQAAKEITQLSALETRSVASIASSGPSASQAAAAARAKLEAARARADYAKIESEMMIEKARIEAKLNTLQYEKEVAAAMAEASILEVAAEESVKTERKPAFEETAERTRQYVEQHLQLTESAKPEAEHRESTVHELKPTIPPRQSFGTPYVESHLFKIRNKAIPTSGLSQEPKSGIYPHSTPHPPESTRERSADRVTPQLLPDGSAQVGDIARYLARRDLINAGLTKFDDCPENYWAWKSSFLNAISGLKLSSSEELDLLIKWLGHDSARHVKRIKTVHVCRPEVGLDKAWERLEECFGSPEIIEKTLFDRLTNFPKVSSKDPVKLRELSDLLQEVEAAKSEGYLPGLSYLDTARGVAPIVDKLPHNIQEKWLSQGFKYKVDHNVIFPPFSFLCDFVLREAQARNDPGFRLLASTTDHFRSDTTVRKPYKGLVSAHKTEISQEKAGQDSVREQTCDVERQCPIHKKPHPLKRCRGFRNKPIEERKTFLKDNGTCFRCCSSTSHMAKNCNTTIKCTECESSNHIKSNQIKGTEETTQPAITSTCTEVCGEAQRGRSCSKICLVKAYVMLDDQSNRSLARSEFFDVYGIEGSESPFTLRTCAGMTEMMGRRATGFVVESLDGATSVTLPTIIECNNIPSNRAEIPTPEVAAEHAHLRPIAHLIPPLDHKAEILLLLGRDLLSVHKARQHRNGPHNAPYAQKLDLGWVIIGDVCLGDAHKPATVDAYHTNVLENNRPSFFRPCPNMVHIKENYGSKSERKAFPTTETSRVKACTLGSTVFDTSEDDNKIGLSIEDKLFLEVMKREMFIDDSNSWVAPLPFKGPRQWLPNNRDQAIKRLSSLHRTLEKRPEMKRHFFAFMQNIFDRDHAELAPPLELDKECWYLPTFGVYHPQKPGQIRVVFDSSAKCHGVSLNDVLLSGPDLNNSLLGVLLRFRRETVAATADIEQMFHSFIVREDHRNYLRFLWHEDNNPANDICEYEMKVHVFGNSPSPSVAIYSLRCAAVHGEEEFGSDARRFVEREFYVDDALMSRPTASEAIDLMKRAQEMLATSNLRLHKIASNSSEVLDAFSPDDRAKGLKELNLETDVTPTQRSLGLIWDLKKDTFTFRVAESVKPFTKRGVLATINGLFDPLGFASPVTIQGKMLLRELSSKALDWDTPLPREREAEWDTWKESLVDLKNVHIPRTYASATMSTAIRKELHIFSDASTKAIAAVAFLKTTGEKQNHQVGFVLGKAKLAPQSAHTIPRLELGAAVLAAELAEVITSELDLNLDAVEFYTDSRVVLGYISNQTKRFYVYVGNRVQRIRRISEPKQWHYVPTSSNPADIGTRSVPAAMLGDSAWLKGPAFLLQASVTREAETYDLVDPGLDDEIRSFVTHTSNDGSLLGSQRFRRFSSLKKLLKPLSLLIHIAKVFKSKDECPSCSSWHHCKQSRTAEELTRAEIVIIKSVQKEMFEEELACIANGKDIPKHSSLQKFSPYCDDEGLLRIGGRLKHANIDCKEKHPLIIPGGSHVAKLIVEHHHQRVMHQGRVFTEGAVRTAGYWITGARRLIKQIIHNCITCNRLRKRATEQRMADLPSDRVSTEPPFTFVGLDVFGSWSVVTRRTRGGQANSRRWAVLFTCLSTRAVHIELIESMDTSSFINALRRFFSLRGPVKQIRSDCGTNFVGACRELGFTLTDPDVSSIKTYLGEEGCTWIFNPPHSSHMGGSWERMIGLSRRILDAMLLQTTHAHLTHEVLSTLMAEVTAIINARPLSPITTDPDTPFLLTPSMLLTQKVCTPLPPPGSFIEKDLHRQQWRQVQYLANTFWTRWRREYLGTLQSRNKWQRNRGATIHKIHGSVGDLVLIKDAQVRRNEWPMGLVNQIFPDKDGRVRKIEVRVSRNGTINTYLRPVSETVLLMSPKD
ncbi:NLR family CARD domain-containing protein 3 [Sarotherodon galilaeus]